MKLFRDNKKRKLVNFDIQTIYKGHYNVKYRGIEALKCPFDYVIYQMIINEVQPDLVIEIGTAHGGGALYLADLMNIVGQGNVHAIDKIKSPPSELLVHHPRIRLFSDGWESYDINLAKQYSKILIIDDASHMFEETLKALHKFWPLVTKGSYYIVEDGIVDELGMSQQFNGGPLKAVNEFMKGNNNFEIDRRWCDFFGENATFNVNGYLRRI
jgi:cephalosporin hydroxylase